MPAIGNLLTGFDPANIAYIFSLFGLFVKDILFLRLLLLSSHMTWFILGIFTLNVTNIVWHAFFITINIWRTSLLLLERRKVVLPSELEKIYQEFFSAFDRKEILFLWNLGEHSVVTTSIVTQDSELDQLFFIVEGKAEVLRDGQKVSVLQPGRFVGEMSFITGQHASADVVPVGSMTVHSWKFSALNPLQQKKTVLWAKIQGLIGKDLVQKIYEKNAKVESDS